MALTTKQKLLIKKFGPYRAGGGSVRPVVYPSPEPGPRPVSTPLPAPVQALPASVNSAMDSFAAPSNRPFPPTMQSIARQAQYYGDVPQETIDAAYGENRQFVKDQANTALRSFGAGAGVAGTAVTGLLGYLGSQKSASDELAGRAFMPTGERDEELVGTLVSNNEQLGEAFGVFSKAYKDTPGGRVDKMEAATASTRALYPGIPGWMWTGGEILAEEIALVLASGGGSLAGLGVKGLAISAVKLNSLAPRSLRALGAIANAAEIPLRVIETVGKAPLKYEDWLVRVGLKGLGKVGRFTGRQLTNSPDNFSPSGRIEQTEALSASMGEGGPSVGGTGMQMPTISGGSAPTPYEPQPQRQIGAQQAGMGIGEAPTQGQLLPETMGEGGAVPLIDPDNLAAQAARRDEIARGQTEMPMAPGAVQASREPLRFDPSTNRYNGDELTPGTVIVDNAGGRMKVDRRHGFMLEVERLDVTGPERFVNFSVDPMDTPRYREVFRDDAASIAPTAATPTPDAAAAPTPDAAAAPTPSAASEMPTPRAASEMPTGAEEKIFLLDQRIAEITFEIEELKRVVRPSKSKVTVSRTGKTRNVVAERDARLDKLTTPELKALADEIGVDPTQLDWYDSLDPQLIESKLAERAYNPAPNQPQLLRERNTLRKELAALERDATPQSTPTAVGNVMDSFGSVHSPGSPYISDIPVDEQSSLVTEALERYSQTADGITPDPVPSSAFAKQKPLFTTPSSPLPQNLKGSRPRYRYASGNNYIINFDSELDMALFTVAHTNKKNEADPRFLKWIREETGMNPREARAAGDRVKLLIKKIAIRKPSGPSIRLPDTKQIQALNANKPGGRLRMADGSVIPPASGEQPPFDGEQPPFDGGVLDGGEDVWPSGIQHASDLATSMYNVDAPGSVSAIARKVPLLRTLLDYERPGSMMNPDFVKATIAEHGVDTDLSSRIAEDYRETISGIDRLFGENVRRGGVSENVKFLGTPEQASIKKGNGDAYIGSFKDMAERPSLYDLTGDQLAFISKFHTDNVLFLEKMVNEYGADIDVFTPNTGGAYVPNIENGITPNPDLINHPQLSEDILPSLGSSDVRVYETGAERISVDPGFNPETDMERILTIMNASKIHAAQGQTFNAMVGGQTKEQLIALGKSEADIGREYEDVPGIGRWFLKEEAAQLKSLQEAASKGRLVTFVDRTRATVLGGDTSPITGIQIPLSLWADPVGGSKQFVSGVVKATMDGDPFAAFRMDRLERDISRDASWNDFFFLTGNSPVKGRPEEMVGSWIESMLKHKYRGAVGRLSERANNAMYVLIIRRTKQLWDSYVNDVLEMGGSLNDAKAYATHQVSKVIPMSSRVRQGQSRKRAQSLRLPVTSVSFIRKPIEQNIDFARAIFKMFTKKKLDPKDKLAFKAGIRQAATIQTISTGGALLYYINQDLPPEKAATKAIKETLPGGRFFMSIVFLDGSTIGLGGPHRSLANALFNENPFEGILKWAQGKLGPALRWPIERGRNRDYFGYQIIPDGTEWPERIVREVAFALEATVPLTAGNLLRGQRLNIPFADVLKESLSEFMGSGLRLVSELNMEAARMFPGDVTEYSDIDETFLKNLVVGSPNLDANLDRGNQRNIKLAPYETRGIISRLARNDDERLRQIFAGIASGKIHDYLSLALVQAAFRGSRREISSQFGDYDREPNGPLETAMQGYNNILTDDASWKDDGDMTDAARKALELYTTDLNPDERKFILRNTNLRPVPAAAVQHLSRRSKLAFEASITARREYLENINRRDLIPQMEEHFRPTKPPEVRVQAAEVTDKVGLSEERIRTIKKFGN